MILYYTNLKYILFAISLILLPVLALLILKVIQKYTAGWCRSLVCLNGKTAIVTGGSSGIGYETALLLASRGCRVILADREDAHHAKNKIVEITKNSDVHTKYLDLSSFQSIRRFAKDINESEDELHILINNATIGTAGNKYTDDGLHATMQINHFGPFLLTHLLTDLLKKSSPSRIIFVSSASAFFWNNLSVGTLSYPKGHPLSYLRSSFIFGNSKLCNVITANGFSERLKEFGVTSNSLNPGLINSGIHLRSARILGIKSFAELFMNTIVFLYGKNPEEGAQTSVYLAMSNKLQDVTGKHFWDCRTFFSPPKTWNRKFCNEIWEKSEEYCGLKPEEKIILQSSVLTEVEE